MYVCLCKGVTDHQIRSAIQQDGAQTLRAVRNQLGVSTQCGKCAKFAKEVVDQTLAEQGDQQDLYYSL